MSNDVRPTPIVEGKAAKRFYKTIGDGRITEKQQKFLDECLSLLDSAR